MHAPSGKAVNRIYVGENEHTAKLGYQLPEFSGSGYDILVSETYAVLSGPLSGHKNDVFNKPLGIFSHDDIGAWHAVSALLERLGLRFYAPYENGTILPKLKNIVLDPGRVTRQAAFDRRQWCYYGAMATDREGVAWFKRLKCGTRTEIVCNHTMRYVVSDEKTTFFDPETRRLHPS
ncbi:MAG: hypothetical protein WC340_17265 [Kiritimatiellia bacterium]